MTEGYYNEDNLFIPGDDVLEAVETLITTAIERLIVHDEPLFRCRVCNGYDCHEADCPIVRLQAWQQEGA